MVDLADKIGFVAGGGTGFGQVCGVTNQDSVDAGVIDRWNHDCQ